MIKWDEITVGFWAFNIEHERELKGTCPGTDISLITSSTCENHAATFEVNMINHSQDTI